MNPSHFISYRHPPGNASAGGTVSTALARAKETGGTNPAGKPSNTQTTAPLAPAATPPLSRAANISAASRPQPSPPASARAAEEPGLPHGPRLDLRTHHERMHECPQPGQHTPRRQGPTHTGGSPGITARIFMRRGIPSGLLRAFTRVQGTCSRVPKPRPSTPKALQNFKQNPRKIREKPLVFHMKIDKIEIESHPDERNQNRYETQD
ncbi:hypothetical protein J2S94_003521 [Arthrobacter bambusae]|nr:hypothetical protein [Arthrobacter bambusae]